MNRLNFLLLRKSRLQFIMLEVELEVRGQIFITDARVNKCYWLARYINYFEKIA